MNKTYFKNTESFKIKTCDVYCIRITGSSHNIPSNERILKIDWKNAEILFYIDYDSFDIY